MQRAVIGLLVVVVAAGVGLAAQPTTVAGAAPAPLGPGGIVEPITATYDRQGNRVGGDADSVGSDSLYWKDYYSTAYLKSSAKDPNPAPADRTAMAFQDSQTVVCMDPTGDYVYEVYSSTMRRFSTTDGSYTSYTLDYPGNAACGTDGRYVYVPNGKSIYKYTTTGTYVNTTTIDYSTNQYAFAVANDTLWAGEYTGVTYYGYACSRFNGDSITYDATWNVGGGTGGAGMNIAFDGTYYYWAMGGYGSNSFKRFYSDRTLYTDGMVSTDCRGVMCKFLPRVDVACVAILAPPDSVDSGRTVTPKAVIRNVGTAEDTFDARFAIGAGYSDTVSLTLAPGATDTVDFEDWEASEFGTFAVTCSTMLSGDVNAGDDAVHDSVVVGPFTGVHEHSHMPAAFSFENVLPNPTRGRASVRYGLPRPTGVRLSVYSTAGTLVRVLQSGLQDAGCYRVSWDGRDEQGREAKVGVYLMHLDAGSFVATRKLVVQR
jgi:hypothetical protein